MTYDGKRRAYGISFSHRDELDVDIRTRRGNVVGFDLNYRTMLGGRWHEVYRVDTRHGHPHIHRCWREPGQRIEDIEEDPPYDGLLRRFHDDIVDNWRRYRFLYRTARRGDR